MVPNKHERSADDLRRSIREQAEATRAEWAAGLVRLGGVGDFAGINDPDLGQSYLDAARDLLDRNRDRLRQFALPIFFLQRHALELALKQAINAVLAEQHISRRRTGNAPEAERIHVLPDLLEHLRSALGESSIDLGKLPVLVERFDARDEGGTWARYRSDHDPAELDLGGAQQDLDDLYEYMFAHPTRGEGEFGWVVEIWYVINDFLTREELGPGSD